MRILVADDHAVVRKGIKSLLEKYDAFAIICEAANGQEAVDKANEFHPHLVILDLSMPVLNGFDAARAIRVSWPEVPILILSMHGSKEHMDEAKKIGVQGYVSKTEAGQTLIRAVDAVIQNHTFFPPGAPIQTLS